jgi:type II secretory ATPase GspE/PulE/Tfp pilus assembly ATPase PilB-like protein
LRQDPQVLMLGEIRDAATASLAVQASLSGHRLISTLHAATPAGAIGRLLEMGLEPYQISSALFGVVSQRLLRRRVGSGDYASRVPAAEVVLMDDALRQAVLARPDSQTLQRIYEKQTGYCSLSQAAAALVAAGLTDQAEVSRVLGSI